MTLNIMKEREILSKIRSNLIVNIFSSFQDFSNLYLVLKLMKGGDLRYHLIHYFDFYEEDTIKFIIINIALCLRDVHQNGVIHRDIKPENFIFDEDGYLHLTDFGFAIYKEEDDMNVRIGKEKYKNIFNPDEEIVGTLPYIAPELILGTSRSYSMADIYSFGVIIYEIVYKQKPYKGITRYEIGKDMINNNKINKKNKIFAYNYKYNWDLFDLIRQLLEINPENRLGATYGINEIFENEYLKDVKPDKIEFKIYVSPFKGIVEDLKKTYNKKELFEKENYNSFYKLDIKMKMELASIEANPDFIYFFRDYSYVYFGDDDDVRKEKTFRELESTSQKNEKKITNEKKERISRSKSSSNIDLLGKNKEIKLPPIIKQLKQNDPEKLREIYIYIN